MSAKRSKVSDNRVISSTRPAKLSVLFPFVPVYIDLRDAKLFVQLT